MERPDRVILLEERTPQTWPPAPARYAIGVKQVRSAVLSRDTPVWLGQVLKDSGQVMGSVRRYNSWLSVVICLCVPLRAQADTVSIPPTKDNTLFSTGGATSNGAGDAVFSGRTGVMGGGVRQRAVLAFDVTGNLPADATVTSASLTLWLIDAPGGGGQTHTLHRLLADWGEGTSSGFGGTGAPATPAYLSMT